MTVQHQTISRWVPTTAGRFLISGLVLTTAGRFLEARNRVRGRFDNQRTVGHFMQATNWARGIFAILILNLTEEDIRSTTGHSEKKQRGRFDIGSTAGSFLQARNSARGRLIFEVPSIVTTGARSGSSFLHIKTPASRQLRTSSAGV